MAQGVTMKVDAADLEKRLADMQARARDLGPVLEVAKDELIAINKAAFRMAKSPDGTKWPALSDVTLDRRKRVGKKKKGGRDGLRPLEGDTAALKGLMFTQLGPDNTIEFGSGARSKSGFPYWLTHQFGTTKAGRGRKTVIPRRAFFPINEGVNGELEPMREGAGGRFFLRLMRALGSYLRGDASWQR